MLKPFASHPRRASTTRCGQEGALGDTREDAAFRPDPNSRPFAAALRPAEGDQAYCKTFVRKVGPLGRNESSTGRDRAAKECACLGRGGSATTSSHSSTYS